MALIILEFRKGEAGYSTSLIAHGVNIESISGGFLPELSLELQESLHTWQSLYRSLEAVRKVASTRIKPIKMERGSISEAKKLLKIYLNTWLENGDSQWNRLQRELERALHSLKSLGEEVCLMLDLPDRNDLMHLPWQEWKLLDSEFPDVEIAMRMRNTSPIQHPPNSRKVRILAVVGDTHNLDIKIDLEVIKKLRKKGIYVEVLSEPSASDLCNALSNEAGFYGLIFIGHSSTHPDGSIGYFHLNPNSEPLEIDDLKRNLSVAIANGLQLAVFNSCDGLGLAHQLAERNLPRCIVMREPIPNEVAGEFLRHFFEAFTKGKSLVTSISYARRCIENFEKQYPGVSWLPVICSRESAARNPFTLKASKVVLRIPQMLTLAAWITVIFTIILTSTLTFNFFKVNLSNSENSLEELCNRAPKNPKNSWRYGGSTAWAALRDVASQEIEKICPDFNLLYLTGSEGSGEGIRLLLDQKIAFSLTSRPLESEEYQRAQVRDIELKLVPIALDGIAVAVHPDLDIEELTVQQIRDIYIGKVNNWSQIGGSDREIVPYSSPLGSGGVSIFQNDVMKGKPYGKNVVFIDTPSAAVQKIYNDPEKRGIYMASARNLVPQCKVKTLPISKDGKTFVPPYKGELVPSSACSEGKRNQINDEVFQSAEYPFTRYLYVVIRDDNPDSLFERAGRTYTDMLLTPTGQSWVEQAGFIPLGATTDAKPSERDRP